MGLSSGTGTLPDQDTSRHYCPTLCDHTLTSVSRNMVLLDCHCFNESFRTPTANGHHEQSPESVCQVLLSVQHLATSRNLKSPPVRSSSTVAQTSTRFRTAAGNWQFSSKLSNYISIGPITPCSHNMWLLISTQSFLQMQKLDKIGSGSFWSVCSNEWCLLGTWNTPPLQKAGPDVKNACLCQTIGFRACDLGGIFCTTLVGQGTFTYWGNLKSSYGKPNSKPQLLLSAIAPEAPACIISSLLHFRLFGQPKGC